MWKFPFYEIGQPIPWNELENEFKWFRDMKGVMPHPQVVGREIQSNLGLYFLGILSEFE